MPVADAVRAPLSQAVLRVKPSATIAVSTRAAELKRQGRDVIGLGAGEPDFDTPEHVKEAAVRALAQGKTKYTSVDGAPELKAAVAAKFKRENGLDYAQSEINVSAGGKGVISNAFMATLDPGDEVVIPAPYWVSYPEMARLCAAVPVFVPAGPDQDWKISPDQLAAAITPRTKWVILNSPNNPTGAAMSAAEIGGLARVLLDHPHVWALSDDLYEHVLYDGARFATIAAVEPRLKSRTLTVNGVAKAYAMTGWRIGYGGGPAELISAMAKVASQTTSNPCSISQWATIAALEGPQDHIAERTGVFKKRRDLVVAMLNAAPGLACKTPSGAFYVFADASGLIGRRSAKGAALSDDLAFAEALLEEEGVAIVPGTAFGWPGAFRLSYATSTALLEDACGRIQRFCRGVA